MYQTSDIRKGLKIEIDDEPYIVTDFQFVKPGKGNAFTRCRLKSLTTGRVRDETYKTGTSLQPADLEERDMQYLYTDGTVYTFMDNENYEQIELRTDVLGDAVNWLIDNTNIKVLFHRGTAINIELPTFIDLEITHCEPGVKGDTATNVTKPATLSTGAVVNVPLFINEGETITIDTRTGEYNGRAKS